MKNAINILLASICIALIFLTKNTNLNKSENISINQTSKDVVIQKDDIYENAKKTAKKENKSIILVFGTNWCVWCQKFEHDTLTSSRSISAVESHNAIIVKINVDKNQSTAGKYGVKSIPCTIIVDKNENEIKRKVGYMNIRDFISWLD
jgi:thioredoxin-related protein